MLKALYGVSLGVMVFLMSFMAPSGRLMTTSASPERVKQDTTGPTGARGVQRTRSRYVFIGSFGK